MEVSGYVVRFCGASSCSHTSSENCPNATDTKYYINPEDHLNVTGTPLVVAHNSKFVVGKCISQVKTKISLFLRCVINDIYFLDSLRRRFNDYKDNYNSNITFETFCKKTLSSFSLSHEVNTGVVRHVSLVDTPGRQGTAVDYKKNLGLVLVRRPENQFISDIIATHSAAYLTTTDRASYLLKSTSLSHNPTDICYINASRKMDYQDQFQEAAEIYKVWKTLNADKNGGGDTPSRALKRNRKTENDGSDNEDEGNLESSRKLRKTDTIEASCATETAQPMVVEAMKSLTAALEKFNQHQLAPPPVQPTENLVSPLAQPKENAPSEVVDAGRARATITINPDNDICELIVKSILGQKPQ